MKNWKQFNILSLLVVFVIALCFIGCDPDEKEKAPVCECPPNTVHPFGSPCTCPVAGTSACDCTENDPVLCTCDPKAHLGIDEKCPCGGSGCKCTEQTATLTGTDIKIRKEAGVTVAEMNTAIPTIQTEYTLVEEHLDGKIKAIHITKTGKEWQYTMDKVLVIKLDKIDELINNIFGALAIDTLEPGMESVSKARPQKNIFLVGEFNQTKNIITHEAVQKQNGIIILYIC